MTIDEFLTELLDILQRDEPLNADMELNAVEEWDSMSVMACQTWFNMKFGIMVPYKKFAKMKTVRDLIDAAEGHIA